MTRWSLVLCSLLFVTVVLAIPNARRLRPKPTGTFRVGLVFDVGGLGDKSFNDAAYAGLLRAQREVGIDAEMVEPSSADDREAALRLFAARGFSLVIGVGFLFSRDVDVVAADYPKLRFACVDYSPPVNGKIPSNVTGLAFREHEGAFLVGVAAGAVTQSKKLGFLGGMDIPLIHKFEAGFRAGVGYACSRCNVEVAYAGSTPDAFRDPAMGKSIAMAHLGKGVDVIFHASGATGHGMFEALRAANRSDARRFGIGVDSDQFEEAPDVVLTSMVKRADVAVFDAIAAASRGLLSNGIRESSGGEVREFGLREAGVDWVHEGPHAVHLSPAVRDQVERAKAAVVSGVVRVPDGQ